MTIRTVIGNRVRNFISEADMEAAQRRYAERQADRGAGFVHGLLCGAGAVMIALAMVFHISHAHISF